MKKKLITYFLYLFIFLASGSCSLFEECDGPRYQIKKKKELPDGLCFYRAESITNCLIWNDQKFIEFTDSCNVYGMSEIRDRKEFYDKYGI